VGLVSVQGQCSGPVFRASVQGQFSGPVFRVSFQGQCSGSVFRVSFQGQCWDSCEGFGSEDFLCAKGLGFVVYLVRRVWGFRAKGLGFRIFYARRVWGLLFISCEGFGGFA
jgi:hypothetical protein